MTVKNRTIAGICAIFIVFAATSLLLYKLSEQARKKAIIISRMDSYASMVEKVAVPDSLSKFIPSDIRITFTDSLGNVAYDSYGSHLASHADRPEIRAAILRGEGHSVRRSETSSLPYIYYARRTGDGRIVRVAQVFELDLQHIMRTDWALLAGIVAIALAALMGIYILVDKAQRRESDRAEQEKRRLKHEMTGNISHELKTPVAGIQGYLEILVRHPDCPEEKRKHYMERAFAQSMRLSDLIRDISLVTRMEEAPQQFPEEKIFLKASVDQVIEEMADQISEKGMSCRNQLPEGCEITANGQLVYAIFRNLTENSVKYAGRGTVITIEGTPAKGIIFRDNGIGVSEEEMEHIFDRFWRGNSTRSEVSGSGLGLSIVKNALLLHGGSIHAFTPEPCGLGFVIKGLHHAPSSD
ncbi:MAG: hypothetical protein HUJ94_02295 [Bacteroidales bacterium]|nr:hypothetical protein [Bacteroidales bacterium]